MDGVWEWRILKLYQKPDNAAKNEQAMAFMSVKGPGTFGSYDYGDTYLNDIHPTAVLVSGPDILKECGRR
ncbi:MAG: hypothetical protein JSS66_05750 [Armatimonadetes bacterium]|nr:hypothetical protein [Armatimonadota bacterium]